MPHRGRATHTTVLGVGGINTIGIGTKRCPIACTLRRVEQRYPVAVLVRKIAAAMYRLRNRPGSRTHREAGRCRPAVRKIWCRSTIQVVVVCSDSCEHGRLNAQEQPSGRKRSQVSSSLPRLLTIFLAVSYSKKGRDLWIRAGRAG